MKTASTLLALLLLGAGAPGCKRKPDEPVPGPALTMRAAHEPAASAAHGDPGAPPRTDAASAAAGPAPGDGAAPLSVLAAFASRESLAGTRATVRGKVAGVMPGLMGRNWIHLRDGTGEPGEPELVVTSQQLAAVGDTVRASGVVATDKRVGPRVYPLLLEDAVLAPR